VAVEKLDSVTSVATDMQANTVTVTFDDDSISVDEVVDSLNDAGYVVKARRQLN